MAAQRRFFCQINNHRIVFGRIAYICLVSKPKVKVQFPSMVGLELMYPVPSNTFPGRESTGAPHPKFSPGFKLFACFVFLFFLLCFSALAIVSVRAILFLAIILIYSRLLSKKNIIKRKLHFPTNNNKIRKPMMFQLDACRVTCFF